MHRFLRQLDEFSENYYRPGPLSAEEQLFRKLIYKHCRNLQSVMLPALHFFAFASENEKMQKQLTVGFIKRNQGSLRSFLFSLEELSPKMLSALSDCPNLEELFLDGPEKNTKEAQAVTRAVKQIASRC